MSKPIILRKADLRGLDPSDANALEGMRAWNAKILDYLYNIKVSSGNDLPDEKYLPLWFLICGGYQIHYLVDIFGVEIFTYFNINQTWNDDDNKVLVMAAMIFLGDSIEHYVETIKASNSFYQGIKSPRYDFATASDPRVSNGYSRPLREFLDAEKHKFRRFLAGIETYLTNPQQNGAPEREAFYLDGYEFNEQSVSILDKVSQFKRTPDANNPRHWPKEAFSELSPQHVNGVIGSFHDNAALGHYHLKSLSNKERCVTYALVDNVGNVPNAEGMQQNGNSYYRGVMVLSVPRNLDKSNTNPTNLLYLTRLIWFLSLEQMGLGNVYKLDFAPAVQPDSYIEFMLNGKQSMIPSMIYDAEVAKNTSQFRYQLIERITRLSVWQIASQYSSEYTSTLFGLKDDLEMVENEEYAHNYHRANVRERRVLHYHLLKSRIDNAMDYEWVRGKIASIKIDTAAFSEHVAAMYVDRNEPLQEEQRMPSQPQVERTAENQQPQSDSELEPEQELQIIVVDKGPQNSSPSPERHEQIKEPEQPAPKPVPVVVRPSVRGNQIEPEEDDEFGTFEEYVAPLGSGSQSQPDTNTGYAVEVEPQSPEEAQKDEEQLPPLQSVERLQIVQPEVAVMPPLDMGMVEFDASQDGMILSSDSQRSTQARYDRIRNHPNFNALSEGLRHWMNVVVKMYDMENVVISDENIRSNTLLIGCRTMDENYTRLARMDLRDLGFLFNVYRTVGKKAFSECFKPSNQEGAFHSLLTANPVWSETPVNILRHLTSQEFTDEFQKFPRYKPFNSASTLFELDIGVTNYYKYKTAISESEGDAKLGTIIDSIRGTREKMDVDKTTRGLWDMLSRFVGRGNKSKNDEKKQTTKEKQREEEEPTIPFKDTPIQFEYQDFMNLVESSIKPVTWFEDYYDTEESRLFSQKLFSLSQDASDIKEPPNNDGALHDYESISRNWERARMECTKDLNKLLWCVYQVFSVSKNNESDRYVANFLEKWKKLFVDESITAQLLKTPDGDVRDVSLLYDVEVVAADSKDLLRNINEKRMVVVKVLIVFDGVLYNTRNKGIVSIPDAILDNVEYMINRSLQFYNGVYNQTKDVFSACSEVALKAYDKNESFMKENPLWYGHLWNDVPMSELAYPKEAQLEKTIRSKQIFFKDSIDNGTPRDEVALKKNNDIFWMFMEALNFIGVKCNAFRFEQVFYLALFKIMDDNRVWDMPYVGGFKKNFRTKPEAVVPGFFLWMMLVNSNQALSERKGGSMIKKLFDIATFNMLQHYHYMNSVGDGLTAPVKFGTGKISTNIQYVTPFSIDVFGQIPIEPAMFFHDGDVRLYKHWVEKVIKRKGLSLVVGGASYSTSEEGVDPVGIDENSYAFRSADIYKFRK